MTEQKAFEVGNIHVAKTMIELGCQCIGCYLSYNKYLIFQFPRNEQTIEINRQARKLNGKL